ncbi:PREDICTED: UPF0481 protein At3g47200-like [Nelumbo nucifera]|uniref:UPF0481 protein At3g47200-like n=2 Tax=Nelumbo nucifera TaxID=4432 RepID=A0A1U8AC35_NELNU|nr:PREDICTED: UPF0481 protein At3g47200-like [Nelumbo nucifera]XP_010259277.1 PREDICTED: UPF0481 protein At3g47200-like [Nelumbo nucifera]DAD38276.1 TPA_asm: hypothetical protein HUJ06_008917 [Nelumbo nucifera]
MTIPELKVRTRKLSVGGFVLVASPRRRKVAAQSRREQAGSSRSVQEDENERGLEDKQKEANPNSQNTAQDWIITIKERLDQVPASASEGGQSSLHRSIFRVPRNLREMDQKAYVPQIVSIGPYHHGKARLQEMEKQKWRLLRHVLERTSHPVELYLEAMVGLEEKARQCYSKPIDNMDSREFVEMMLLDACFILELLNASVKGIIHCGYSWGDPVFTSRGVVPCIQRDLLMLENQLPLFVLDRLFALTCDPNETTESVSQLALEFFDSVIPGCRNQQHELKNGNDPGLHLLHVVRQCLLPSSSKHSFQRIPSSIRQRNKHKPQLMTHCVTMLRDAGVKFRKNESTKFMDIKFKKGILYIPPLVIHDSTKSIFLNLMAFEQCYPHCSNHVTSYVNFMDGLVNSPQDVGYLRYRGIIDHGLGNEEEVADLLNRLCREVAFDINDCYLSGVSFDLNRYFEHKWHAWRASLKHDYFNSPWAIISLLAAIFLIGLTLTQTVYGILAYYAPLF